MSYEELRAKFDDNASGFLIVGAAQSTRRSDTRARNATGRERYSQ